MLRAFTLVGDASFAIYLSHPFTLVAIAALWHHTGIHEPSIYIAVAALASISVGVGLCVALERPLMRRLNAWARKAFGPTAPVSPLFRKEESHAS